MFMFLKSSNLLGPQKFNSLLAVLILDFSKAFLLKKYSLLSFFFFLTLYVPRVVITDIFRQKGPSGCPFCPSVHIHRPSVLVYPFLSHGCSFIRKCIFIVSVRGKTPSALTRGRGLHPHCVRTDMDLKKNKNFRPHERKLCPCRIRNASATGSASVRTRSGPHGRTHMSARMLRLLPL
jgi:hypothetical protein